MISYYDWLIEIISVEESRIYKKLYEKLFETEFYAKLNMDRNRLEDGMLLRERYISCMEYKAFKDNLNAPRWCTCLEMMVALAIRMEEDILFDPDEGNRTGIWFHMMLDNLGLLKFDDGRFDSSEIDYILSMWLDRRYQNDGRPHNIFKTNQMRHRFQKLEIWYQMNDYIEEFL